MATPDSIPETAGLALPSGAFILCGCQPGAEGALAGRQADALPRFSRGAWRRGVVTFRAPEGLNPPDDFWPDLIFARTVIRSVGQVVGRSSGELATKARDRIAETAWGAMHLWRRDERLAIDMDAAHAAIVSAFGLDPAIPPIAKPGDRVLDCVIDTEDRWWVGWHRAGDVASTWPGGRYPKPLPEGKVSRAWLKLDEAITVFGERLMAGERALELGCSPGGACQRLLEDGLEVVGVDAAVVDGIVAAHPRFTQWRMRARDVPLKRLRGFDWLLTDMNIDPRSTMEALGRVIVEADARPRGVIATLKLPDWSRAAEVPAWLQAFRSWGYAPRARQLSTGGREICVVAHPIVNFKGRRGPSTPTRAERGFPT